MKGRVSRRTIVGGARAPASVGPSRPCVCVRGCSEFRWARCSLGDVAFVVVDCASLAVAAPAQVRPVSFQNRTMTRPRLQRRSQLAALARPKRSARAMAPPPPPPRCAARSRASDVDVAAPFGKAVDAAAVFVAPELQCQFVARHSAARGTGGIKNNRPKLTRDAK